jgi:peptidoglycan hydrolase-like protein with peptidoglycan-binding domain
VTTIQKRLLDQGVIVLSRSQWRADNRLPRRGHLIGSTRRTEVFIHHTVVIDRDTTPNEWQTLSDVKSRMRQLQTMRPNLGLDVPYNFVAFCMGDGRLALCEGRGFDRTGAHARNHNRSAIGIAFQGDFENHPLPRGIDAQLAGLTYWLRDLRMNRGFIHLGDSRPADRQVWGHRDAATARTACPGKALHEKLDLIRFIDAEDEQVMDQPTWKLVQRSLQAQTPALYVGSRIDGKPGPNTNRAVRAFERRVLLDPRGVIGTAGDPNAAIWPATRELLFAMRYADGQ